MYEAYAIVGYYVYTWAFISQMAAVYMYMYAYIHLHVGKVSTHTHTYTQCHGDDVVTHTQGWLDHQADVYIYTCIYARVLGYNTCTVLHVLNTHTCTCTYMYRYVCTVKKIVSLARPKV